MDQPDRIVVDVSRLDLNDLIDFEEIAGIPFDEFVNHAAGGDTGVSTSQMMRVYRALLFITGRRTDPAMTLHDAGASVTLDRIAAVELKGTTINPPNGGESKLEA